MANNYEFDINYIEKCSISIKVNNKKKYNDDLRSYELEKIAKDNKRKHKSSISYLSLDSIRMFSSIQNTKEYQVFSDSKRSKSYISCTMLPGVLNIKVEDKFLYFMNIRKFLVFDNINTKFLNPYDYINETRIFLEYYFFNNIEVSRKIYKYEIDNKNSRLIFKSNSDINKFLFAIKITNEHNMSKKIMEKLLEE